MMQNNAGVSFRKPLLKTFANAINGLLIFFKKERNGKIQAVAAMLVITAGFCLHLSGIEWILILLCICLVLSFEMLNSAIEHLCNMVHNEFHPSIKIIKDVAAGAVLFASVISVVIALIIFIPKIIILL